MNRLNGLRERRVAQGQDICGDVAGAARATGQQGMSAQWGDSFDFGLLGRPASQDGMLVWLLRRNCSISPRQLLLFFVSLALVSLFVAMLCWVGGAKLVPPFTLVELLTFGGALLMYARHAGDRERVAISAQALVVEWECAGRCERAEFNPRWARIVLHDNGLVAISESGRQAFVGRYTRPERREKLARDLRRALLAA